MNNRTARTDPKAARNLVRVWGKVSGSTIDDGYGSGGLTVVGGDPASGVIDLNGVLWNESGSIVFYRDIP